MHLLAVLSLVHGRAVHQCCLLRASCRVDCPISKVPADLMVKHEKLVFAALDALQPIQPMQDVIGR